MTKLLKIREFRRSMVLNRRIEQPYSGQPIPDADGTISEVKRSQGLADYLRGQEY